MFDADSSQATDAPIQDKADSLAISQRGLRDLAALLALPAMWVDHDPDYIATGLLGVLFGVLRLESGYVRFDDPVGGPALECWRPDGPYAPESLERVIASTPTRKRGVVTVEVEMPSIDGAIRVVSISPTLPGEDGIVLVGCHRTDFPTEYELHLLRIAVSQAAISIHTARRLADERAARVALEGELRLRNEFLAALVHELTAPLAMLSEQAAQAHAFATATNHPSALTSAVTDDTSDLGESAKLETGASPLTTSARLSRREAEVLGLLAQGLSNKEIAGVLWLSERTVERHITGVYRKIGVERRSEATAFAFRHSLVAADGHEE